MNPDTQESKEQTAFYATSWLFSFDPPCLVDKHPCF